MVRINSRPSRAAVCSVAILTLAACQDVPKYKHSSGHFDEWGSYEGKHFRPADGAVAAVDPVAGTITITHEGGSRVYPVTSITRIMHNGDDVPLAQLPLNQEIKFTVSPDGSRLLTIWYGTHSYASARAGGVSHRR
jgi:hypothetical protein